MRRGQNCLLKKAMGLLFCIRTAPIAFPDAFVLRSNGMEKFGMDRMEAVVIACLSVSNTV